MPLTTVLQQLEKAYAQHQAALGEKYTWYKVQQDAFALFRSHISTTATKEKYKYTPIHKLLPDAFDWQHPPALNQAQQSIQPAVLEELFPASIAHYAVVLTDGKVNDVTYAINNDLPFQLTHFSETTGDDQHLVDSYWERYIRGLHDPFAILNTAFFTDGILLQIPAKTVLQKPVCIYNYTKSPHSIAYPRVLISVKEHSEVSFINHWHTLPNLATYTNAVVDMQLAPHVALTHYTFQLQGEQAYQIIHTNYYQQAHSKVDSHTFISNHKLIRNNLASYLAGPYAQHNMYGMYALGDTQHVDNHTIVKHQQPHTESKELYKGILTGNATSVFNGSIHVQPEAQKTNAFQTNHNILLSDSATMHTKPQLQILADDVKCSHGATFGSFDNNQLFYLQARGIPHQLAQQMLLQAFMDEMIHKVPSASLQAFVAQGLQIGTEKASL